MKISMPLNALFATLCFQSFAFGASGDTENSNSQAEKSGDIQIVYFSKTGNTEKIAKYIQEETGGNLIKISSKKPYPEDYTETTEVAKKEVQNKETPEITLDKEYSENAKIIFIGSPCWWKTIASPVRTFLSTHNFDGKIIIPFITHGGSEMGETVEDIKTIRPKATVKNGKAFGDPKWIHSSKPQNEEVKDWIKTIDLSK